MTRRTDDNSPSPLVVRAGWALMVLAIAAGVGNAAVCIPAGRALSGLGLAAVVLLGFGAALVMIGDDQ